MSLASINAHPRDLSIEFLKEPHKYKITRAGVVEFAPTSVTSFCKPYFTQFDPLRTIELHYSKWKANPNSKYYAVIHTGIQSGSTDEQIKEIIMKKWVCIGSEASVAGTDMHERAENVCNGIKAPDGDREMRLLVMWMKDFQPDMAWKPFRTEWVLWWDEPRLDDAILVAGTLDLLMKSETTGEFALVDFKRTNPSPKYQGGPPNLLEPCGNPRYHPGYATSPLVEVEDSKYGAYCMQLNILAKMLRERYNIDVGDNMYLLQMHCVMEHAHWVRVPSYKQATNTIFSIECERIATTTP